MLGLCCFTLHCCVWASHCRGFSCCGAQALGAQALVVVTPELCCTLARGIFPPPGIEPMSPVLGGRFFTAGPPRKPSKCHLKRRQRSSSKSRKCLSMFLSFLLFWLDVYICVYIYICVCVCVCIVPDVYIYIIYIGASLVAQMVKNLSTMWEICVQTRGWEDPLEKEIATHSSILAWEIPWTEKPGWLQSMGS